MANDPRSDDILTVKQKYAPCLARIGSYYATLTEAELRVAQYILENPGYVLASSIAGLARESNVGLGTVNRLSNKLGYHSYNDLKIALAVELLSPHYEYVEPITPDDDAGIILQKVIKIGIQNLYDLGSLIDTSLFAEVAALLSTARRVEVYATGGLSGPIAQMTQYRLLMLGVPCTATIDPQQQVIAAGLLEKDAIAIGLSNSGESPSVTAALQIANQVGSQTLCITGSRESSVARASNHCLLVSNRETFVASDQVTSRLAMLSVLEALYAFIAIQKYRITTEMQMEVTDENQSDVAT